MLVYVTVHIILMLRNPIRRPTPMLTNYVLRLTPIGMHIDDVISIVGNHREWRIWWVSRENGFVHPHPQEIRPLSEGWPVIVGEQSIRVQAGRYRFNGLLLQTTVSIFWAFDEEGMLTEIYIWKSSR